MFASLAAQGVVSGGGGKFKVISLKEPGEFKLAVVYFFVSSRHGTVMRHRACKQHFRRRLLRSGLGLVETALRAARERRG
jgi:hypothetical protein